jgi:S-adenosylmethionine:tRNA-ribosyltransferase-isomerase (queuine synthetase)
VTIAAQRPGASTPVTQFTLPLGSEAVSPPERRGVQRDRVRLLVARPGQIEHRHFFDLPDLLAPGDLIVVNTSATLPAAVTGRRDDGQLVPVHVSTSMGVRSGWSRFAGSTVADQISRRIRSSGCTFPAVFISSSPRRIPIPGPLRARVGYGGLR